VRSYYVLLDFCRLMLRRCMSLIPDMIAYWKRPQFTTERMSITSESLIDLIKLLAFSLGGVFALMIFTGFVFQILGAERPNVSEDFAKASQQSYFIILAVILAPIVEEVLFRSWLGVKWGVLLILPILLWSLGVIIFLQDKDMVFEVDVLCLVGLTVLTGLYIIQYCRTANRQNYHEQVLERLFPFIFWATLFAFGLIHLSNFDINMSGPLMILIVLPQIFIGAVLGFLRMRFGLISAIGFHAAYNGVLIGLSALMMRSVT